MDNGSNIFDFSRATPCPECHGLGYVYRLKPRQFVPQIISDDPPKFEPIEKQKWWCRACRGKGY